MGDSRGRVNYDEIAHLYDGQLYRGKKADANLLVFLSETHRVAMSVSVLDIGCGTGNQLFATDHHAGRRLSGRAEAIGAAPGTNGRREHADPFGNVPADDDGRESVSVLKIEFTPSTGEDQIRRHLSRTHQS